MYHIRPFKGRTVRKGQRVFVYRNLHSDCWSIKAVDGPHKGKVVGHADSVVLQNADFVVSEAGRQRVLREKRKNVHAGVIGDLSPLIAAGGVATRVRYNPYEDSTFVVGHVRMPLVGTQKVADLDPRGRVYV